MSTLTPNLGLVAPELSDNGRQTILDLANNMRKIDEASEVFSDGIPTSGDHKKNKKIYYSKNLSIGDYVGVINLRAGRAAPLWASLTQYSLGAEVLPTGNNGHYYKCIQSGYSAPFEPNWTIASGSITEDTRNKTTWKPSTRYEMNDIVIPSIPNDRFYVCIVAGTSGSSEPIWATTNGVATTDNGVVWMTYRIVKWIESGVSVNFRPFGKIE